MPIIASGNRVCEKCGKSFLWEILETPRKRMGDVLEAVTLEPSPGYCLADKYSPTSTMVKAICPHCGYDNHFDNVTRD